MNYDQSEPVALMFPKTKKARPQAARKAMVDKLDHKWSKVIHERAGGQCEKCDDTFGVQAHHIIKRKFYSTRWNLANGILLCLRHHTVSNQFSAHGTEEKFKKWVRRYRGNEAMDELEEIHQDQTPLRLFEMTAIDKAFTRLIKNGIKPLEGR